MRNSIFLFSILVIIISSCSSKQTEENFEGIITYTNTFTSFTKQTPAQLAEIYGDTIKIAFKEGNYHQWYNSTSPDGIRELIYNKASNFIYMKIGESDTFQSFPGNGGMSRKLYNHYLKPEQETILGMNCDAVTFESAYETPQRVYNITSKFFFHPTMKMNEEDWAGHTSSYFDIYASLAKAVYIKYHYMDHEAFSYDQVAINIDKKELDNILFEQPLITQ